MASKDHILQHQPPAKDASRGNELAVATPDEIGLDCPDYIARPTLVELLALITPENSHAADGFGARVGKEIF